MATNNIKFIATTSDKISDIVKDRFPNWNNNKYYKMLTFKQRIVAILTYKKNKKLLYLLYLLNSKKRGNKK